MKLTTMTICAAALIVGSKAFAGDLPKSTIIFEPTVTLGGVPEYDDPICPDLYARYPRRPTSHKARVLNLIYGDLGCHWEGRDHKPKPRPKPCRKPIEDKGGAIVLVPCDHELGEGQSE